MTEKEAMLKSMSQPAKAKCTGHQNGSGYCGVHNYEPEPTPHSPTHTPTPWKLANDMAWSEQCKDRGPVFECRLITGNHIPDTQNYANAAFIVKAVNAYEPMRVALKAFVDTWDVPLTKSQREARIEKAKQALAIAEGGK